MSVGRALGVWFVMCAVLIAPVPVAAAGTKLLLDVIVNAYSIGKVGEFEQRGKILFATAKELTDLGFRVPSNAQPDEAGFISLSSMPGLTYRVDEATQILIVSATNESLLPQNIIGSSILPGTEVSKLPVETSTGAYMNYDFSATSSNGNNVVGGMLDMRGFSPLGAVSSTGLGYLQAAENQKQFVRLDSTYVYSDPDTLRRYRLGDVITNTPDWARSVRLGGVQIASDFSMRPDLVTYPLPVLGSSATVPSTLDVMVNGTKLFSQQVQPGPFLVSQLPIITGAGTVGMTMTDALGHQSTVNMPFYASTRMLAADRQSYSLELGMIRQNWGLISNDYGDAAGSATYSRGLTDYLTIESHTEAAAGLAMGGLGTVLNIADFVVANISAATAHGPSGNGSQFSAGVQRNGSRFSFGVSGSFASPRFQDIGALSGNPVPVRQIAANIGLSFGNYGSLGLAYADVDRKFAPQPEHFIATPYSVLINGQLQSTSTITFQPSQYTRLLSASYSVQMEHYAFYTTGFADLTGSGVRGAMVGVTIPLGGRSSASLSAGSNAGAVFGQGQVMQSADSVGDWGYRVSGVNTSPGSGGADLQYKSPWALLTAGADRYGSTTLPRLEAQGAIAMADGRLFASNVIDDSFAVVDTDGTAGIHVNNENRPVGATDASGRLILPDLRSFEANQIGIEPNDLPFDATVPITSRAVRPQYHSGVVAHFPMKRSFGALLQLVDEAGHSLPIGSMATLQATGTAVPIGYDGKAFVQNLSPNANHVLVQQNDGSLCMVVFDYNAEPGTIPHIGPLICRERQR